MWNRGSIEAAPAAEDGESEAEEDGISGFGAIFLVEFSSLPEEEVEEGMNGQTDGVCGYRYLTYSSKYYFASQNCNKPLI